MPVALYAVNQFFRHDEAAPALDLDGRDLATLLAFRLAELGIDAGSLALSTMAE